ncbi:MAG: hypothetical protein R2880_15005 [Deinococcales bacterium]
MIYRLRRLRQSAAMRELVAEADMRAKHFIMPYFVVAGKKQVQPIATLDGVSRLSVDTLLPELEKALKLGIRSVMLFGVLDSAHKDGQGSLAADPEGPVNQALKEAKRHFGQDLVLMTDVCLCGYTTIMVIVGLSLKELKGPRR